MRWRRIRNRSDTVAVVFLKVETADCVQPYSERLCYPDSACTTREGGLRTMERNKHQYGVTRWDFLPPEQPFFSN